MSHPARPPRVVRHADIDSNKLRLARRFRQAPTAAEATAWQILRDRAIFGLKFRRQQLIAGFIVDFYCPAQRLVLELDGGAHDDPTQRERDLDRSQILSLAGNRISPRELVTVSPAGRLDRRRPSGFVQQDRGEHDGLATPTRRMGAPGRYGFRGRNPVPCLDSSRSGSCVVPTATSTS